MHLYLELDYEINLYIFDFWETYARCETQQSKFKDSTDCKELKELMNEYLLHNSCHGKKYVLNCVFCKNRFLSGTATTI